MRPGGARWLWVAVALALAASTGCTRGDDEEHWLEPVPAPPLAGVAASTGQPMQLSAQRGHVVMLAFGYTGCSDVCPITLSTLHGVFTRIGADSARLRALYVSVDPARDTAERIRRFVQQFDPRIEGLWVAPEALAAVQRAYGVRAVKRALNLRRYLAPDVRPDSDYSLQHTPGIWLISPDGELRVVYAHNSSPERVARGVRTILGG
jgi:protein SCO1/2